MAQHFTSVDEYIASLPADVQTILQQIRSHAHAAVPGAGEMISYGIPTITLNGHYVVYFAAWKHHVSVYPVPRGDVALERAIAPYLAAKGTLKFPLGNPVPYELIGRVAARLAAERHGGK